MMFAIMAIAVLSSCNKAAVNPDVQDVADSLNKIIDAYDAIQNGNAQAGEDAINNVVALEKYLNSDVVLTEADCEELATPIMKFSEMGGEKITKEETVNALKEFKNLGEIVSGIYGSFAMGMSEQMANEGFDLDYFEDYGGVEAYEAAEEVVPDSIY